MQTSVNKLYTVRMSSTYWEVSCSRFGSGRKKHETNQNSTAHKLAVTLDLLLYRLRRANRDGHIKR